MKAIAVIPGQTGSIHLAELPKPRVEDVPGGRDPVFTTASAYTI